MVGKGVSSGIAIGPLLYHKQSQYQVEKRMVDDVEQEQRRFESARALAARQLGELAIATAEKLGEENGVLFEIHQMMLEDTDYQDAVSSIIREEHVCAEYAVMQAAKQFEAQLSATGDEYMQTRAADIQDVSQRVVQILLGVQKHNRLDGQDGPVVLAAKDFAPSETAQLDRSKVLALLTAAGSPNSHTAIFARTMGIPAVTGLGEALFEGRDGQRVALNGDTGQVELDPDTASLAVFRQRQEEQKKEHMALQAYVGQKARTKSGKQIQLYANIGLPGDVDAALSNDAEGIGLFRSEFLFLERNDFPTEDMQFEAYKAVLSKMKGKKVIIRTLDIGADKQADYFALPQEENPALGMRAIRLCLSQPQVFKTQLRALYRAASYGNLSIMFPMVTSVAEVRQVKALVHEALEELKAAKARFCNSVELGIMIETPASAIISDLLAAEVDFFSIGTNDLTQYTLALDRQNPSLERFLDAHHEAVLRLIRLVVQNAHDKGKWVGICGELAADTGLTKAFIEMGMDELSVVPSAILPLRKIICGLD